MHPISCTNIHHDITDLVNHGMVKNTKTWISWKRNIFFLQNKKILNLCLRWHIFRSYPFLAEVTFKLVTSKFNGVICCGPARQILAPEFGNMFISMDWVFLCFGRCDDKIFLQNQAEYRNQGNNIKGLQTNRIYCHISVLKTQLILITSFEHVLMVKPLKLVSAIFYQNFISH